MVTERSKKKSPERMVATTVYIDRHQQEALQVLKVATGVPAAEYVRQGVDAVLKKHVGDLFNSLPPNEVAFSIWTHPDEGYGILVPDLPENEVEALKEAGFALVKSLKAMDEADAQQQFIEWCHSQQPDAKVERVSFSKLRSE